MKRAGPQRIVFLGTFDPPHLGHAHCIAQGARAFPDTPIMVLPSFAPAGAGGQHKSPAAAYDQRVAMLNAMLNDLDLPERERQQISVSEIERDLPAPNYTENTLQQLVAKFGVRPTLMMGRDQFASFDRWRNPREILQIADVIVVDREDKTASGELSALVRELADRLELQTKHVGDQHFAVEGMPTNIWIIEEAPHPAASTLIREQVAGSQNSDKHWLAPSVIKYMDDHKLYKDTQA